MERPQSWPESGATVIDARDMVVTPGFCNGHMHISYAHAARGVFPDDLGPVICPLFSSFKPQ